MKGVTTIATKIGVIKKIILTHIFNKQMPIFGGKSSTLLRFKK